MVGGCAVHFQRLGYIGVPSDVEIVCNVGDVGVCSGPGLLAATLLQPSKVSRQSLEVLTEPALSGTVAQSLWTSITSASRPGEREKRIR